MTLRERFEAKYVVDPDTGCWLWTDSLTPYGYAFIYAGDGLTRPAHRVAYELHVGPIPEGLNIDHTCHNDSGCAGGATCLHRRCVNPEHLEAVTDVENILRGAGLGAQNARKTHCKRGHEFTPENTLVNKRGWRSCRACARQKYRNACSCGKRKPPGRTECATCRSVVVSP